MNLYFSGEHKKDDNLNNVCKTVDGISTSSLSWSQWLPSTV